MLKSILVDAGPLIALFDRSDKYHQDMLNQIRLLDCQLVTTNAVLAEVSHMLSFNVEVQLDFFRWVMIKGVILHEITQTDIAQVVGLIKQYRDRPMDFADATLVVAADKTGIRNIISVDSDFNIYRLPGKVQIKNIFFDP